MSSSTRGAIADDDDRVGGERGSAVGVPAGRRQALLLAGVEEGVERGTDDQHEHEDAKRPAERPGPGRRRPQREQLPRRARRSRSAARGRARTRRRSRPRRRCPTGRARPPAGALPRRGSSTRAGRARQPAPTTTSAGGDRRRVYATHCHRAHCATETPRSSALTATIAVWTRPFRPSQASARKNGNTTRPNRGSDSSGQRSLGTLSGIARLAAQKSPYGAPNRRQATTVSSDEAARGRRAPAG